MEKDMMRTLVNLNPTREFRAMDEIFEQLFGSSTPAPSNNWLPIDISEFENSLNVRAAVPGVNPEDLEVVVDKGVLTIKGETRSQDVRENEKVYRREITTGSFTRSIRLPDNVDADRITADFNNGIVSIAIPRQAEIKPQPIRISVANTANSNASLQEPEKTNDTTA